MVDVDVVVCVVVARCKRIREILNPTNIVEEDEEDIDFTLFDDTYT
jgi:hypothetical protein